MQLSDRNRFPYTGLPATRDRREGGSWSALRRLSVEPFVGGDPCSATSVGGQLETPAGRQSLAALCAAVAAELKTNDPAGNKDLAAKLQTRAGKIKEWAAPADMLAQDARTIERHLNAGFAFPRDILRWRDSPKVQAIKVPAPQEIIELLKSDSGRGRLFQLIAEIKAIIGIWQVPRVHQEEKAAALKSLEEAERLIANPRLNALHEPLPPANAISGLLRRARAKLRQ